MALDVVVRPVSPEVPRLGGTPARRAPEPPAPPLTQSVTVNLSRGGLSLYSNVRYAVGTTGLCAVTLPGHATPIEAVGVIAWFIQMDRAAHEYKVGIDFVQISPEHTQTLETLLAHPPIARTTRAKKLLLVDDDRALQLAFKLRLESVGFEVVTADDGLQALRKGREEHPHLIILDLMLPQLNGYEVCRLLKFDQQFTQIPIILFTARGRPQDLALGKTVGADAYVTKPCSGTELITKIEELLSRSTP